MCVRACESGSCKISLYFGCERLELCLLERIG